MKEERAHVPELKKSSKIKRMLLGSLVWEDCPTKLPAMTMKILDL